MATEKPKLMYGWRWEEQNPLTTQEPLRRQKGLVVKLLIACILILLSLVFLSLFLFNVNFNLAGFFETTTFYKIVDLRTGSEYGTYSRRSTNWSAILIFVLLLFFSVGLPIGLYWNLRIYKGYRLVRKLAKDIAQQRATTKICENVLALSHLDEGILTALGIKSPWAIAVMVEALSVPDHQCQSQTHNLLHQVVGTDLGTPENWRHYLEGLGTQKEYEDWKRRTYTPLERLWIKENLYLQWKRQMKDDFDDDHRNNDDNS